MSLGPDDMVLCAGTLASTPLPERAEVAAEAGFRGLSLFLDDLDNARKSGLSDADIRALLKSNGLEIAELDPLLDWTSSTGPDARITEEGRGFLRWHESDFYAAAETVGARSINAALFVPEPIELPQLVDAFGALCDRASAHGLLVHLEFMPFSQISSVDRALEIVGAAGRSNGGIMFDVWHYFRGDSTPEALARAASSVTATQLDDAPKQAEANLVDETMHRRRMPGEGDAGVVDIIRTLDAGGCAAPLGVEVFDDSLAALSPREIAKRAADATRRVRDAARG